MFNWLFGPKTPSNPKMSYWKVSAWVQRSGDYNYGVNSVVVKAATQGEALSEGIQLLREQFPVSKNWNFSQLNATYVSE